MDIFIVTSDNVLFRAFKDHNDAYLYMERKIKINHDHCCVCKCNFYWEDHKYSHQYPKWEIKHIKNVDCSSNSDADYSYNSWWDYSSDSDLDSSSDNDRKLKEQYTYDDERNIMIFFVYSHNIRDYDKKDDNIVSAFFNKESAKNHIKEISLEDGIKYIIKVCKFSNSCLYDEEDNSDYISEYNDISEYKDDYYTYFEGYSNR